MTLVKPTTSSIHQRRALTSIGADERSMVSVRRSTMDLISMYKEQENTEMERVLKMVRTESIKGL